MSSEPLQQISKQFPFGLHKAPLIFSAYKAMIQYLHAEGTQLSLPGHFYQLKPTMNLFMTYISILVTCPLLFTVIHFFTFFLHLFLESKPSFSSSLRCFLTTKFNKVSKSFFSSNKEELREKEEETDQERKGSLVTANDALIVMRRLGLWRGDKYCKDVDVLEGAYRLLEEKEASLEELEEAFAVFDEDGDGVITANELRNVLKRLGFREGIGLEDCRRMIFNHDLDGDGRIGFKEFKSLLERAT